jgi:hypothetical protein
MKRQLVKEILKGQILNQMDQQLYQGEIRKVKADHLNK